MSKRTTSGANSAVSESKNIEESTKLSASEILVKGLQINGKWDKDSFPEFMSIIFWLRQLIGIVVGITCGSCGIAGVLGFFLFVSANTMIPFVYYRLFANIDIDDFGPTEVLSEGYQPSFGMFMLFWIVVYTICQHP